MLNVGVFFLSFLVFLFIIFAVITAFWIWMIVDAAKREYQKSEEKVLWILVIVLGGFIGAIVYFFVVRYNS